MSENLRHDTLRALFFAAKICNFHNDFFTGFCLFRLSLRNIDIARKLLTVYHDKTIMFISHKCADNCRIGTF